MKTSNKLALLAALGMALAGVSVQAQPDSTQPQGPPHARFGQVLQSVIQAYDADKNGQLDSAEMAALQQDIADGKVEAPGARAGGGRGFGGPAAHLSKEILDTYDTDKDGRLNDTERAVLHQDIQSGKLPPPAVGRGPRGPMAGLLSAKQILERFDADRDGKLDETELTAFLDSRPGPGPMRRRGGGPPPAEQPSGNAPEQQ